MTELATAGAPPAMNTLFVRSLADLSTPPDAEVVNDLLDQAQTAAAAITGPSAEVTSALVRGMLAVAAGQLVYAATGERQAGENARRLLSELNGHLSLRPGIPAELSRAVHLLALAGRAYSGR